MMSMGQRIFVALVLGLSVGFLLHYAFSENVSITSSVEIALRLVSGVYLSLLQMLVIPLVLFTIIHSILHFRTASESRFLVRISLRAVIFLLVMTSIAAGLAMWLARHWQVGAGLVWGQVNYQPIETHISLVDSLLGLLPTNPFQAMAGGNTVAVAIFAVIIGLSGLSLYKTQPTIVEDFHRMIASVLGIIKQMTKFIISLTPYGVFALIVLMVMDNGFSTIIALSQYLMVICLALLGMIILQTFWNWIVHGYSPWNYFRLAAMPLLVAFTTRSSLGTLPVTEETLLKKFKVNQLTASFVPSIGATLGMNACAGIFPGIVIAMTMMTLGQPITSAVIIKVMAISAITSLGISGIPGTAFFAASAALNLLGLPYFMLGVVQSVDPIVDMGRTATNVNGAITAALFADPSKPKHSKIHTIEEQTEAKKQELILD